MLWLDLRRSMIIADPMKIIGRERADTIPTNDDEPREAVLWRKCCVLTITFFIDFEQV